MSTFPPVFLTWTFRRENRDGSLGASGKAAAPHAFSWPFTLDLIVSQPVCERGMKSNAFLCIIFQGNYHLNFPQSFSEDCAFLFITRSGITSRGEPAPRWGVWWGRYLQPPSSGPLQKVKAEPRQLSQHHQGPWTFSRMSAFVVCVSLLLYSVYV